MIDIDVEHVVRRACSPEHHGAFGRLAPVADFQLKDRGFIQVDLSLRHEGHIELRHEAGLRLVVARSAPGWLCRSLWRAGRWRRRVLRERCWVYPKRLDEPCIERVHHAPPTT